MKTKRDNRQRYKDTFDSIKLSEEGYRQIRNMEETMMNHNQKRKAGLTAIVSLAALAIAFCSANGIAYAATSSTLVEQAAKHISVYINGKPYDNAKITPHTDENGNTSYEVSIDEDETGSAEIYMTDPDEVTKIHDGYNDKSSDEERVTEEKSSNTQEDLKTTVEQADGKTYLVIEGISDKPTRIDITEDYADGMAEGNITIDHADYQYLVKGDLEKYSVDLEKK